MPTTFTDQFWIIDPYAPPPAGSTLTVFSYAVVDNNNNGLVNRFSNDRIDGSDIRAAYSGDTVTVQLGNGSTVTITGATFYLADGRQVFTPTDGSLLQNATLVNTSWVSGQSSVPVTAFGPACYTPGTLIDTPSGPRKVEDLNSSDLISTLDAGAQPLLWRQERHLDADHLARNPKHEPIRIAAGALGNGLPHRALVVSPQHRMVLRSPVVDRMFGAPEIMVPACQLVGQPGIHRQPSPGGVRYIHLLMDHHAVVLAEGAPAESLYLGEQVHETLTDRDVEVLRARLPDRGANPMKPAREFVRGARLRNLLARLEKNQKPMVEPEANTENRLAG